MAKLPAPAAAGIVGSGLAPGVCFYRTAVDPKPPSNAQVHNAFDRFPRSLDRPDFYDYRDVNTWGLVRRNDIHGEVAPSVGAVYAGSHQLVCQSSIARPGTRENSPTL
ncbi:MAG: hypothetical protein FJ399_15280 [Verrucomicrobia bacterium]|nr:hypothetical protein [Verrucomicrobiota bacterium]